MLRIPIIKLKHIAFNIINSTWFIILLPYLFSNVKKKKK